MLGSGTSCGIHITFAPTEIIPRTTISYDVSELFAGVISRIMNHDDGDHWTSEKSVHSPSPHIEGHEDARSPQKVMQRRTDLHVHTTRKIDSFVQANKPISSPYFPSGPLSNEEAGTRESMHCVPFLHMVLFRKPSCSSAGQYSTPQIYNLRVRCPVGKVQEKRNSAACEKCLHGSRNG
ncbi:hypothetical protein TGDOM2_364780 [Toxoplasma gondii GAB2-2007-GAL-DOM2]|uniref:Uncharacterized protein n=1 Tax=Toxoplasma gondii GAB2-2007-GAL-DOM2 TaxID=1130820 RepID=A0A086JAV4_TOXGO|nr:hypothetical protein TGDOM2_364780 [Toxoplasma gondii GAB2-2007-GAL-DOM2]